MELVLPSLKLTNSPSLTLKINQLNDLMKISQGIIISGPNMSGKSTLVKVLSKIYDHLKI